MPTKKYVIVLDTETCNGIVEDDGSLNLDESLVYDCGFSVVDLNGNVYEEYSYVIKEVFYGMKDIMSTAYYADKIPNYWKEIWAKKRDMINFTMLYNSIHNIIKKYNVEAIVAHNARFDVRALNNTIRYLTKSKKRFFFPCEVEIWDTMKMAQSVIAKKPSYKNFCDVNNFMTKHSTPRPQITAEVLYRYIINDISFIESHTALEDVQIEREIMWYCIRQHKKMDRVLYEKRVLLFP